MAGNFILAPGKIGTAACENYFRRWCFGLPIKFGDFYRPLCIDGRFVCL